MSILFSYTVAFIRHPSATSESDIKSNIPFRIKNAFTEKYISTITDEEGFSVFSLSELNPEDPSQYFRLKVLDQNVFILNSADANAKTSLSASPAASDKSVLKLENERAAETLFIQNADGTYRIMSVVNNIELFLGINNSAELKFDAYEKNCADWIIEYVYPEKLELAYYKTRMKLYSVSQIHVNVIPSALYSFISWSSDNENVILISEDGTLCTLNEGVSTITASLCDMSFNCITEVYNRDAFTWFSQKGLNDSYWNARALSNIKFYNTPFASETTWSWMEQGCAVSSVAMVFRNMQATYKNGYDFRSNQRGNLPADPYTVALANVKLSGFPSHFGNHNSDPVYMNWTIVTKSFFANEKELSYTHVHLTPFNLNSLKKAVLNNPEGVVVQMTKSNGETHYIVFAECLNPEETISSKLKFIVYDPLSYDGSNGDRVLFEESASYALGFRYSDFDSVYYWDIK